MTTALLVLVLASSAFSEAQDTPLPAAERRPLIMAVADRVTAESEAQVGALLKQWEADFPFARYAMTADLPLSVEDLAARIELLNRIGERIGQKTIPTFGPLGLQGWTPSSPRGRPGAYVSAISRDQLWDALGGLQSDWVGLSTEGAGRVDAPQLQAYIEGLADALHSRRKQLVVWFSAQMLYRERNAAHAAWFRQWDSRKVDYFVWMDMPAVVIQDGVPLGVQVRDILATCPSARTFFQWTNSQRLPTATPDGTRAYMQELLEYGARGFCVLAGRRLLAIPQWYSFYRGL